MQFLIFEKQSSSRLHQSLVQVHIDQTLDLEPGLGIPTLVANEIIMIWCRGMETSETDMESYALKEGIIYKVECHGSEPSSPICSE